MYTDRSARHVAPPPAVFRQRTSGLLILITLLAVGCGEARAQEASAPQQREDGPPPLRYLPQDVRGRLEAERDPKSRARLGMLIAEECLMKAEQFADQDQFVAATG